MAQDVIITPASGKIEFNNSAGSLSVTIQESSGDLSILPTGDLIIGDGTPGNVEFGGSGVPVTVSLLGGGEISSGGNSLDIGITGDTINLNVSGVTYNFPGTITASLSGNATTATNISGYSGTYWTSNNDGTGSGLDADLLDGLQASQFLRSDADDIVSKQLTFPSAVGDRPILQGGFLSRLSGDGDADIWGISEDYYPSQGTASNAWGIRWASTPNEIQFVGANANKLRIDLDTAGKVYIDDNEVWHVGNDGSGSGLDADLLDGQEGSYYAAASSLGSYLPLTGGTLTGSLLFGTSTNDPSSPPLYIEHTALSVSPYSGLIIKNTSTIGNTYTGVAVDAYTQSHYRYMINGNLKWQTAVNSSDDRFVIYSWASGSNLLQITNTGSIIAAWGDLTVGGTGKSSDTVIRVQSYDTNKAGFVANGWAQGTAYFEWSQNSSSSIGGGVVYNGDGTPAYGAGEVTDRTTFYRISTSKYKVFDYAYSDNTVTFYGDINCTATCMALNFDEGINYSTGVLGSSQLWPAYGSIREITLSGNVSFGNSFEYGESMTLMLTGGNTYTVTWPTMTWIGSSGNVAPTLNGTKDVIVLWRGANGVLYGAYVGYGA